MFRNMVVGEVKVGERSYQLVCEVDSPVGEIHDALMLLKGAVVERMVAAHKEQQEAAEKQSSAE